MRKTISLVRADLIALYGFPKWIALATNPSAMAALTVRMTTGLPRVLRPASRWLGILLFSVDISSGAKVGPGLRLPHPVGIVIGDGVQIGANVTIYQGVTLGSLRGGYPKIGSDVSIFTGAVVVGGIDVGEGAVIGALSYIDKNVLPRTVVKARLP
ncbi:serine acetyltransferase [Arenimonas alkanexedens]